MRAATLLLIAPILAAACTTTTQIGDNPPVTRTFLKTPSQAPASPPAWSIAIHGGAGVIERASLTPEQDRAYCAALAEAISIGAKVLDDGGQALDAIEATARFLEDNPLFNAGRGAAIDASGKVTLDAAIMLGDGLKAGAVAGVTTTRHPITLARKVMEATPHVFLIGEGADTFAREQGLEQVPNTYFMTARRWQILEDVLRRNNLPLPAKPEGLNNDGPVRSGPNAALSAEARFGTIGVVVRDRTGRVAAGTSTGGLTGKRWGRVGDVPVIGAGTYANPDCAISATGTGEYFIRLSVAREICTQMRFGQSLSNAARDTMKQLGEMGGDGGVIGVNKAGELIAVMNTPGMYRAQQTASTPLKVAIYADEN
jgi:L-asparaginase / beta-aspartyl-peptidase